MASIQQLREQFPTGTRIRLTGTEAEAALPPGLKGTVSSVDDAGRICVDWDDGTSLSLSPDHDLITAAGELEVLYVPPGQPPVILSISDSLESMQDLVGGNIEMLLPFDSHTALICNEEGKLLGLPMNRALRDTDGSIYDVICGDFFLVRAAPDTDRFTSLSRQELAAYREYFQTPELFFLRNDSICAVPVPAGKTKEEMFR